MKRAMSSKERVLTALARQEPDRIPINYFANAGIDSRLRRHFGLADGDNEGLMKALAWISAVLARDILARNFTPTFPTGS